MENNRVVIAKDFCVGCSLCVNDCPSHALIMTDEGVVYAGKCLECGHCVAVCPVNAVSMPEHDMADVVEFDPRTFKVEPKNLLNLMKHRRSVRFYANREVPEGLLHQILEAGRHAPTASNTQAVKFVAVQADLPELKSRFWDAMPGVIEELKAENHRMAPAFERFLKNYTEQQKDGFFFGAPTMLLVFSNNMWDAGLATGNMELMAAAHGLGALHNGYLKGALPRIPGLMEWLGCAEDTLATVLLCGYPGVQYTRTAPRKKTELIIR